MPKLKGKPLQRVHLRLYREDIEKLYRLYGNSPVKITAAAREIIHTFLAQVEQSALASIDATSASALAALEDAADALLLTSPAESSNA